MVCSSRKSFQWLITFVTKQIIELFCPDFSVSRHVIIFRNLNFEKPAAMNLHVCHVSSC